MVILPLTIFSALRNYDLIAATLGNDLFWVIGGFLALFALDGGALIWKWALDGADCETQRWLALGMVLLDLVGALAGTMADTMLYLNRETYLTTITTVTIYAIPTVIFINLAAAFVYHIVDPEREERMAERKSAREMARRRKEIERERELVDLEVDLAGKRAQIDAIRMETTRSMLNQSPAPANNGHQPQTTLAAEGEAVAGESETIALPKGKR